MNKIISTLLIILMHQAAWSETAAELVQRDVTAKIRQFSRETRLYHYFQMPASVDQSGKKSISTWFLEQQNLTNWLGNLVASRAGAFWDLNNHDTYKVNAGPGLYLALDPNSSREYGDTMLLLDVPADSKYISTVSPIPFKSDTLAALVRENIVTAQQLKAGANTLGLEAGLTDPALKNMVLPENSQFRVLLQNVFESAGISFIEYGYKSHQNGFCKGGRLTAFVFIGSKPAEQTAKPVLAVVNNEFKKQYLAADYLVGFFGETLNTMVDLTVRYRNAIIDIRANAFDAPKVVNWSKALPIIDKFLTPQEADHLRDISFECKKP